MPRMTRVALATTAATTLAVLLPVGAARASSGHFTLIESTGNGTHSCSFTQSVSDLDNSYTGCSISDDAYRASNYDSVAWVIYDDKSYKDRKYCIRPGRIGVYLSDRGMSSKVSSIKKLSTSSCAGYTEL